MFRSAAGCLQTHAMAISASSLQRLFIFDVTHLQQIACETLL